MARFILDVANLKKEDIKYICQVIERDSTLSKLICTINCIDETNENQFYTQFDNGETNELSKTQIQNFKNICN
jgi:hypothetical protein